MVYVSPRRLGTLRFRGFIQCHLANTITVRQIKTLSHFPPHILQLIIHCLLYHSKLYVLRYRQHLQMRLVISDNRSCHCVVLIILVNCASQMCHCAAQGFRSACHSRRARICTSPFFVLFCRDVGPNGPIRCQKGP